MDVLQEACPDAYVADASGSTFYVPGTATDVHDARYERIVDLRNAPVFHSPHRSMDDWDEDVLKLLEEDLREIAAELPEDEEYEAWSEEEIDRAIEHMYAVAQGKYDAEHFETTDPRYESLAEHAVEPPTLREILFEREMDELSATDYLIAGGAWASGGYLAGYMNQTMGWNFDFAAQPHVTVPWPPPIGETIHLGTEWAIAGMALYATGLGAMALCGYGGGKKLGDLYLSHLAEKNKKESLEDQIDALRDHITYLETDGSYGEELASPDTVEEEAVAAIEEEVQDEQSRIEQWSNVAGNLGLLLSASGISTTVAMFLRGFYESNTAVGWTNGQIWNFAHYFPTSVGTWLLTAGVGVYGAKKALDHYCESA